MRSHQAMPKLLSCCSPWTHLLSTSPHPHCHVYPNQKATTPQSISIQSTTTPQSTAGDSSSPHIRWLFDQRRRSWTPVHCGPGVPCQVQKERLGYHYNGQNNGCLCWFCKSNQGRLKCISTVGKVVRDVGEVLRKVGWINAELSSTEIHRFIRLQQYVLLISLFVSLLT